jgi:hypothetical protein
MAYPENIECIVREFTDRLTRAVTQHVATLVAETLGQPVEPRWTHPSKGKPMTPKPCPKCGQLTTRRRYSYHCEAHTADYLASKAAAQ